MGIETALALAAAFGAGGLAWGYRGQRDQEREQVVYLRGQLREARGLPPPSKEDQQHQGSSRALATVR